MVILAPLMALLMPLFNSLERAGVSSGGVVLMESTSANATLGTFTEFVNTILTWFITSMRTVLGFLIENPIALWSIIVGMIIAVIGMIFNILRGH